MGHGEPDGTTVAPRVGGRPRGDLDGRRGRRLGDPLRIGDFGLISASIMAWIGIIIVVIIGTLVPSREGP
jgi:hypothetical protein